MSQDDQHIELYGDPRIASADAPVPTWLKWLYVILPIWGIITGAMYWNGSWGWADPGHWYELQTAANTTYPFINQNQVPTQREDP